MLAVDVVTSPGAGPGVPLELDGFDGEALAWVEKA